MELFTLVLGQIMRQGPGGRIARGSQASGPDGLGHQLAIGILDRPTLNVLLQFKHPQIIDLPDLLPLHLAVHGRRREEFRQSLVEPHRPLGQTLLDADVVEYLVSAFVRDRGDGLLPGQVGLDLPEFGFLIHHGSVAQHVIVGHDVHGHLAVALKLRLGTEDDDDQRRLGWLDVKLLRPHVTVHPAEHGFQDAAGGFGEQLAAVVHVQVPHGLLRPKTIRQGTRQPFGDRILAERLEGPVRLGCVLDGPCGQYPVRQQHNAVVADLDSDLSHHRVAVLVGREHLSRNLGRDRSRWNRQAEQVGIQGLRIRLGSLRAARFQEAGQAAHDRGQQKHVLPSSTSRHRRLLSVFPTVSTSRPTHRLAVSAGSFGSSDPGSSVRSPGRRPCGSCSNPRHAMSPKYGGVRFL